MKTINVIKSGFALDESEYFEGYTAGELWNGWACPYFALPEAKKLIEWYNNYFGDAFKYDQINDVFVYECQGEEETIHPIMVMYEGDEIKTYPIGYCGWCWFDANWSELNNFVK